MIAKSKWLEVHRDYVESMLTSKQRDKVWPMNLCRDTLNGLWEIPKGTKRVRFNVYLKPRAQAVLFYAVGRRSLASGRVTYEVLTIDPKPHPQRPEIPVKVIVWPSDAEHASLTKLKPPVLSELTWTGIYRAPYNEVFWKRYMDAVKEHGLKLYFELELD